MSDVSKDDSAGDTTLELSHEEEGGHGNEDDRHSGGRPHRFSDQGDQSDDERTPIKLRKPYVREPADPVKVLQLSQPFFVSDTMEDDDDDVSMIIPPTPSDDTAPFIIPSTPPGREDEEILEESQTILPDKGTVVEKQEAEEEGKSNGSECDETFADTEDLLDMPTQRIVRDDVTEQGSPKRGAEADNDEWNLRLTASQATQSLETLPIETSYTDDRPKSASFDVEEDVDIKDISGKDAEEEETEEDAITIIASVSKGKEEHESLQDRPPERSPLETSKSSEKESCNGEESDDEIEPSQISKSSFDARESSKVSPGVESAKTIIPDIESVSSPSPITDETQEAKVADLPEAELFTKINGQVKASLSSSQKLSSPKETSHVDGSVQKEFMVSEKGEKPESQALPETKEFSVDAKSTVSQEGYETDPPKTSAQMLPPSAVHRKHTRLSQTPQKKIAPPRLSDSAARFDFKSSDDVPNVERSEMRFGVFGNPRHAVGSFSDCESLAKLLQSIGVTISNEKLKTIMNFPKQTLERDIIKTNVVYRVFEKENTVYEEFSILGDEDSSAPHLTFSHQFSPISSSSTTTSTKTSSFVSTPSGEMGDISSSASSKSAGGNISSLHGEVKSRETQTNLRMSMETSGIQTSTQTEGGLSFHSVDIFKKGAVVISQIEVKKSSQEDFQNPVVMLSPIKSTKRKGKKGQEQLSTASVEPKSRQKKFQRKPPVKRMLTSDSSDTEVKQQSKVQVRELSESNISPGRAKRPSKTTAGSKKAPASRRKAPLKRESGGSKKDVLENVPKPVAVIEEDSSSNPAPFGSIIPGVRVMARWKDGYYYPGIVQNEETEGRWCVQFDDGALRVVAQESLLKIALLQAGTSVLALSPDGFYDPGVVSSHYREGKEVGYIIAQDSGLTKRYARGSVILSTEQAKLITDTRPVAPPSLTINLDNIVGGKRKRKSFHAAETDMPAPKSSRPSRRIKCADVNLESTESSANEATLSEVAIVCKVKCELNAAAAADDNKPLSVRKKEILERSAKGKKGAKTGRGSRKGKSEPPPPPPVATKDDFTPDADLSESSDEKAVAPVTDAVPVRSAKLFQGCAFMLSHAARKNADGEPVLGDDSMENVRPYDKEHLCRLIMSGGGVVLETFEEAQKCNKKKIFLLANTHLRTIKYIQCVAASIPCLQHYWVQTCVLTSQFIHHLPYLLPSGYSILEDKPIDWHGKIDIFKGLKIVVTAGKNSDFVNIWTPVLLAAKADLVQKWSLPSFSMQGVTFSVNVIVTDHTCPGNVLSAARRRKIPVVSSEWVIQCIIAGKKLPYDAHPKFKHDFQE